MPLVDIIIMAFSEEILDDCYSDAFNDKQTSTLTLKSHPLGTYYYCPASLGDLTNSLGDSIHTSLRCQSNKVVENLIRLSFSLLYRKEVKTINEIGI